MACPPIGLSVERELRKPGLLWIQLYKTSPPIAAIGGSVERAKVEKGEKKCQYNSNSSDFDCPRETEHAKL